MRAVLFLLAVAIVHFTLPVIPVLGRPLARVPVLSLLASAMLVGFLARLLESRLEANRRDRARLRELGAADTPGMRGKLGAALLDRGRAAQAVEHLEAARAAEPTRREWAYRLAQALAQSGRTDRARDELEALVALDEEYAFGAALLSLSGMRLVAGEARAALEAADRAERNHGPSPESSCRRGEALVALDRGDEAAAAFTRARELYDALPSYQRPAARSWVRRARRLGRKTRPS
jgi:tetratricopeptide (TPR) repeat protein